MLDHYFHRRFVARLKENPFTQQLVALSIYLHNRGYARVTVRHYLGYADHFTRWLVANKRSLDTVDERAIRSFIRSQSPRHYRYPRHRSTCVRFDGLQHFLHVLRSTGAAPSTTTASLGAIDRLVTEYDSYLRDVCGLAPDTRISRTRFTRLFLRATFGTRAIRLDHIQPKHLRSFVTSFGRSRHIASGLVAASSLRCFLRWLVSQGQCSASLIFSIPRYHNCKYTTLPRVMTDQQLRCFMATFDRSTPGGRRDYAMALCQSQLGLRVGEVAALIRMARKGSLPGWFYVADRL
jgi:site-specific recombinase XerD